MANQKIEGIKVLVYVDDNPVAESLSATLNLSTNTIDTTTKSSGGWRELILSTRQWSISDNGLKEYGDASGNTATLESAWLNRTLVDLKFATSITGDTGYQGEGYITSFDLVADNGAAATYSCTIEGTGSISTFVVT
ncbi:phage tail tube protein [Catalinimonas sp. 4WD22]|uniref:phage tail tube protein n=1 Tax=Catalinimonas locisalis TaxID=3133978 RepID=UPI003101B2CC